MNKNMTAQEAIDELQTIVENVDFSTISVPVLSKTIHDRVIRPLGGHLTLSYVIARVFYNINNQPKKYILLEDIEYGNCFFTTIVPGKDHTKGTNGETVRKIIGYAETMEDAHTQLYGNEG